MTVREIYAARFQPPHAARDKDLLAALKVAMIAGEAVTPVVTWGEIAITGSHRIAAYKAACQDYDGIVLPAIDATWACEELMQAHPAAESVWDICDDWSDLCERVHAIALAHGEDDLVAALADQF